MSSCVTILNHYMVDINEMWENIGGDIDHYMDNREVHMEVTPRKSSSSSKYTPPSSCEIRHSNRQSILSCGDTFGLSLKASYNEVSSYLGWPTMCVNRFSLYQLPVKNPVYNQEYAGLSGGTFGWPLGNCPEDKPGKALFLLMLTYEESQKDSEIY